MKLLASLVTTGGGHELTHRGPCTVNEYGYPCAKLDSNGVVGVADVMLVWRECGCPESLQRLSHLVVFSGEGDPELVRLPLVLCLPERGQA